jgi:hypothetical protein
MLGLAQMAFELAQIRVYGCGGFLHGPVFERSDACRQVGTLRTAHMEYYRILDAIEFEQRLGAYIIRP